MSNDMMNRVWWREDIKGVQKNVLLAIADAASDHGTCFPAVSTIAIKSGWSPRAVQKAISELEGMGLIRRIHRNDSSSVYQMVVDNLPLIEKRPSRNKERELFDTGAGDSPASNNPRTRCTPPVNEVHPTPESGAPRTQRETKEEPSLFSGSLALPDDVPSDELIIESVTGKWNELAGKHPGMQACRLPLDKARERLILARSKQTNEDQPTVQELWSFFFDRIDCSPFLQGRSRPTRDRDKPFALSLTWALKAGNFTKIMERVYEQSGNEIAGITADGRAMGAAEQATRGALEGRRAERERRRGG